LLKGKDCWRENELLKGKCLRKIAERGKWIEGSTAEGKELLKENCYRGIASKSEGQD
jgi:hypothetical protein